MQIFIDSADINDIKEAKELGLADGVTTNPTLIMKSGRELKEAIEDIVKIVDGPVLAEVVSQDTEGIVKEGREFASWAENVVVKIPVTEEGLKAVKILRDEKIKTAVTLIFSVSQAILAAKAGADFICPFVGRLDDISHNGMDLISEIVSVYSNYADIRTEVIVASVRTPDHVIQSGLIGAFGVTVPIKIVRQMAKHPLTDTGIERFLQDWEKVKADIN
ncbi:fructose-6-phosphate aldolase [candidate division KSB1 bacterium]|nr:MAG: fructose-6-phosphate aldolase [candidate division KSB1 bacterium]